MFSTPETSVHVLDKNREISPLGREEGYGVKDVEKRSVLRREWKTPSQFSPATSACTFLISPSTFLSYPILGLEYTLTDQSDTSDQPRVVWYETSFDNANDSPCSGIELTKILSLHFSSLVTLPLAISGTHFLLLPGHILISLRTTPSALYPCSVHPVKIRTV